MDWKRKQGGTLNALSPAVSISTRSHTKTITKLQNGLLQHLSFSSFKTAGDKRSASRELRRPRASTAMIITKLTSSEDMRQETMRRISSIPQMRFKRKRWQGEQFSSSSATQRSLKTLECNLNQPSVFIRQRASRDYSIQ